MRLVQTVLKCPKQYKTDTKSFSAVRGQKITRPLIFVECNFVWSVIEIRKNGCAKVFCKYYLSDMLKELRTLNGIKVRAALQRIYSHKEWKQDHTHKDKNRNYTRFNRTAFFFLNNLLPHTSHNAWYTKCKKKRKKREKFK